MITLNHYPIPEEYSSDFAITVNGQPTRAVTTRVSAMPFNRYWPGKQRPLQQTELASYLALSTDEPELEFLLTPSRAFQEVTIRPLSAGICPQVENGSIRFSARAPGQYTVELDGPHHALHLFLDPILSFESPKPYETVLNFGPGVHTIGHRELLSDTTVFIHRDAVVYGSFWAVGAKNIRILGEGVLDGSHFERTTENTLLAYDYARTSDESWEKQQIGDRIDGNDPCFSDLSHYQPGSGTWVYRDREQFGRLLETMAPVQTGLSFYASENIFISGVIFRNCAGLSITQAGCRNVHYDRVKLIGMWRYNSDGIDFYNCQNCSVRNCFLRTFDDSVCVKGQIGWDTRPSSDILVEKCVIWNDWGHAMDIGVDTVAPEICNITFRDCDCIHTSGTVLDVGNEDRANIHHILFENLRIEFSKHDLHQQFQHDDLEPFVPNPSKSPLIDLFLRCGIWSTDGLYGRIENVTFRNLAIVGDADAFRANITLNGFSLEHPVQNIVFEHLSYNGALLTTAEALNLQANSFATFSIL